MKTYKVEISSKTIIFAVLFILSLYFFWVIRDLLYSMFIAFIIMSALRPVVDWLDSKFVSRRMAMVIVYLTFIAIFIFLFSLIIPPIITETINLAHNFPTIIQRINPKVENSTAFETLRTYLPNVTSQVFEVVSGVFSNTLFVISTLFFAFYFLLEENLIKRFIEQFFSKEKSAQIDTISRKAERRMYSWFWGELTLMSVVGSLTYIGLTVLGVRYALSLAVLAGLLEVVPNIGPLLSAVPAFLIGFSQAPFLGAAVAVLYIIVQQLENNIIVPIVMKRAVGINPIVTLMVLVIGGRLGGVVGVLLAIPVFLFAQTIAAELARKETILDQVP